MQYKLINLKTKEETICDKVVIDGFDYYVSDDIGKNPEEKYYSIVENPRRVVLYSKHISGYLGIPVLLSTNPNIGVFKIVDEVQKLAEKWYLSEGKNTYVNYNEIPAFIKGYNKSQETHPFSLEDMVEFANWIANTKLHGFSKQLYEAMLVNKAKTIEELIEIWNNQRLKTIYYE